MKRFKQVTMGATVVMGRVTFESIGRSPLPGRRNIVVTSGAIDVAGVELATSIEDTLRREDSTDMWFIGGARIYQDAMPYCDMLDITYVPDHVETQDAVTMPAIDESMFEAGPLVTHEWEPALTRRIFTRRRSI